MGVLAIFSGMTIAIGIVIIVMSCFPTLIAKQDTTLGDKLGMVIDEGVDKRLEYIGNLLAQNKRRLVIAIIISLIMLILTKWIMAAVFAGVLPFAMTGLFVSTESKKKINNIEAIATWTEMLADTLAGAAGLNQAITASAPLAPPAIVAQVSELATYLEIGIPQSTALRKFATALQEPLGDLVVSVLLMASENRAVSLGEVLGELAVTAREEANMYLKVEAQRASTRSAMRMVCGFSVGFAGLAMLVAHTYLLPYSSAEGQVVLAIVGSLFLLGLWLMNKMSQPTKEDRILLHSSMNLSDLGSKIIWQ